MTIVLLGGVAALGVVPPLTTYDAPAHMYRAEQVARGQFRADRYSAPGLGGDLPARMVHFVDRSWDNYWYKHDFGTPTQWRALATEGSFLRGKRRVEFTNTANYAPLNYLFQATGLALASVFSRSPLVAHQLGGAFNLLGYLGLLVLALQLAPRFERGFLLLGTCPLLLFQAASVSADPINVAAPMLLIAGVWRLRAATAPQPKLVITCLLTGLAMMWLKPTLIATLACTVAIPARQFGSSGRKVFWLAITYVAALAAWSLWNQPYFDLEIAQWFQIEHAPKAPMKSWFLHQPWVFLPVFARAVQADLWQQAPQFFGNVGGWLPASFYVFLAPLTVAFFVGLALTAAPRGRAHVDRIWSALLLLQASAYYALLCLVFWLTFGVVGQTYVPGMGGRYFHPIYLPVAIAWAELTRPFLPRMCRAGFWLALGASICWFTIVLAHTAVMTRG